MSHRPFRDRRDAGRVLAGLLDEYRGRSDVIVLGLPRGGVPVAYEVATALGAPLDVFVVRKLGVPGREELAMGAIASGGVTVINDDVARGLGISPEVIGQVAEREGRELLRREQACREGRPFPEVTGKVVIVVDDGLATGSSMRAAVEALQRLQPAAIVVTVPGRARVHLPGAQCAGRQGGLRDHAVAVLRGREVLLGLHPDRRRRGPGSPSVAAEADWPDAYRRPIRSQYDSGRKS